MNAYATEYVKPRAFREFVEARGYKVAVILGPDQNIAGYELRGPRRNRKVVCKDRDGLLSLFEARLWCDGVDYATGRLASRSVSS